MDELFRFALTRSANSTEALTIPLERPTPFQSNPGPGGSPGLEQIVTGRLPLSGTWTRLEVAALDFVLSGVTSSLLQSAGFTQLSTGTVDLLAALRQNPENGWMKLVTRFSKDQHRNVRAVNDALADLFLALLILRRGGAARLRQVVRARQLSPAQAQLLTEAPTLRLLSDLLHAAYLVGMSNQGLMKSPAEIADGLKATLLLPPKIFSMLEKPVHPVGVTELLVVRQHVLGYELGEIARIENVLSGEHRNHEQKHGLSNERDTFFETETETVTEQELTNTDHISLQNEIATTIEEDTRIEAGLHAQYSGFVNIQADLTAAHDESFTQSRQTATEIAKDVTQRAAQRVSTRVQQNQRTRIIETFDETEQQEFNNQQANVSGVYQWVDKVYLAQVFDYGKHLLFDLMVPEPAASLLQADALPLQELPVPPPPFNISPTALTHTPGPNFYGDLVATYKAVGVQPPPMDTIVVSNAKSFPFQDDQMIAASEVIAIGDGYEAHSANVYVNYLTNDNSKHGTENAAGQKICFVDVTLGGQNVHEESRFNGNTPRRTFRSSSLVFNVPTEHSIPLSIITSDINELSVNVEIECRPTATRFAQWQFETYQAIATAWQRLQDDYRAGVEAADVEQQTVGILGASPSEANRLTERTELKRSCIAILNAQAVTGYDDVQSDQITLASPRLNPPGQSEHAAWVRWFEQAFEWDRISYVLYPYFWGRATEWPAHLQRRYESDSLFEEFLRAGYARVVIPVRTGFDDAVNFFLATGMPWMGGDLPSIGDPTYLPITEEIKERTGAPGDEIPVGDPWEVHLPTRLIKLRKDDKLPPPWTWAGHPAGAPAGQWTWTGDAGG